MNYEDKLVSGYRKNKSSRELKDLPYQKEINSDFKINEVYAEIQTSEEFMKMVDNTIETSNYFSRPSNVDIEQKKKKYSAYINMCYDYSISNNGSLPYYYIRSICPNSVNAKELINIMTRGDKPLCSYIKAEGYDESNKVKWNFTGTELVKITSEEIRNILISIRKREVTKMMKSNILTQEIENFNKLFVPSIEVYESVFRLYAKRSGFSEKKMKEKIDSYKYALETKDCHRTSHNDRHYYSYSLAPKTARSMMKYNGEKLIELDWAGCHLTIMLKEFLLKDNVNSESYDEKLVISRIMKSENPRLELYRHLNLMGYELDEGKFKLDILSWLNASQSTNNTTFSHINNAMERTFPEFFRFVYNIKSSKEGMSNYTNVSRLCLHKESEVMDEVLRRCFAENIFCLGVYDGIDVEPNRVNEAKAIFEQVLEEYGYNKLFVKVK